MAQAVREGSMNMGAARGLTGVCGLLGAALLVGSFVMSPAPPAGLNTAQLAQFAVAHHLPIVLGGWLQGMGALLLVLFSLALVHLAGASQRFAGWFTFLSGACILMVNLVEIAVYLTIAQATLRGDTTVALVSDALRQGVQHVFLIAPALLLGLGAVLLGAGLLHRAFALSALVIGAVMQLLGLFGVFDALQPLIDKVLMVQALWFVAAAVALFLRPAAQPGLARSG